MLKRLRFSLRTAILCMVLAAVGVGIFLRWWQKYIVGRALDNADDDKAFDAWPIVRDALIDDPKFRETVLKKTDVKFLRWFHMKMSSEMLFYVIVNGDSFGWMVRLKEEKEGRWSLISVRTAPLPVD